MSKNKIDKEMIDSMINQAEYELKQLKKQKRKDHGVKRGTYSSTLPLKYRRYIAGANARGLFFELTLEEFNKIIAQNCIYCGSNNKIGVDRIDSSEGYNINNSQPCCSVCNFMKHKHLHEFFIKHIKKVYDFYIKDKLNH